MAAERINGEILGLTTLGPRWCAAEYRVQLDTDDPGTKRIVFAAQRSHDFEPGDKIVAFYLRGTGWCLRARN